MSIVMYLNVKVTYIQLKGERVEKLTHEHRSYFQEVLVLSSILIFTIL